MRKFLLLLSLVLVCGCALKFEDVSKSPRFTSLIGKKFFLDHKMYIVGINLPPGYGKQIDIYDIWIEDNISGPELISKRVLHPGTTLQILSIRRSTNHLFGEPNTEAIVAVNGSEKRNNVFVTIELDYFGYSKYIKEIHDK